MANSDFRNGTCFPRKNSYGSGFEFFVKDEAAVHYSPPVGYGESKYFWSLYGSVNVDIITLPIQTEPKSVDCVLNKSRKVLFENHENHAEYNNPNYHDE